MIIHVNTVQDTQRKELLTLYQELDRDELCSRLIDLDLEFRTFQTESKELEDFLETELEESTKSIEDLKDQMNSKDLFIKSLQNKTLTNTRKFEAIETEKQTKINNLELEAKKLKQKVIDWEVLNDSMESKLRIAEANTINEREKYNEVIERLAILESENQILKSQSLSILRKQQEDIEAKDSQIQELMRKCGQLEKITKLVTLNRNGLKVAKFQTPPIDNTN